VLGQHGLRRGVGLLAGRSRQRSDLGARTGVLTRRMEAQSVSTGAGSLFMGRKGLPCRFEAMRRTALC
jgi:hypothetical protein